MDTTHIDELTRLCTPTSALLLGRIAANPKLPDENRQIAYGRLNAIDMRRNQLANPTLERILIDMLRQLDGKVPSVNMPIPPTAEDN